MTTRGIGYAQYGAFGLILVLALTLAGAGCGSHRSLTGATDVPPGAAPDLPDSGLAQLAGLPALPAGADDPVQPRAVSLTDNYQLGGQAVLTSHSGVFVNGPGLDMGPAGKNKVGWAIWRWGSFQNGNRPRELKTDLAINAPNNYWVLLGDYTTGHWQVFGPETSGTDQLTFTPGKDYISPSGNCYVALLVMDSNKLTVNKLNLVCDTDATPPGPPTGLNASSITPHSAKLKWTAPADADLDHYELWSGTGMDFLPGDAGSVLISDLIPAAALQYIVKGLTPSTHYYMRLRAVDSAGNYGALSNTCSFTTKANQPPVPSFTYSPTSVQSNLAITFDPSATTDPDDPPADLTCSWDWTNDGTDDDTYTGLGTIQHAFPISGPVTVKLTVFDGSASVSTTQSFTVAQQIEERYLGYALSGEGAQVQAADADYATGRLAVVTYDTTGRQLRLLQGGNWSTIDMSGQSGYKFQSVALAPNGKVGALYTYIDNQTTLYWYVYETTGGAWTLADSGTVAAVDDDNDGSNPGPTPDKIQLLDEGCGLDYAANGLVSVAVAHSWAPPPMTSHPDYFLNAYHQKADGTFLEGTLLWRHAEEDDSGYKYYGHWPVAGPYQVRRNDTQTTLVFAEPRDGKIHLQVTTDAGSTAVTDAQVYSGTGLQLLSIKNPSDFSHVSWAMSSDNGSIYYGDNFGAANGSQVYAPATAPLDLLAMAPAGDNQALFYWRDIDASQTTHVRGYGTAGAALYNVVSGVGVCDTGFGGWTQAGGNDGLYLATTEARDGACTGYFVQGATITRQDAIVESQPGDHVGQRSIPFITKTGGLMVLAAQQSPSALLHTATTFGGAFTTGEIGADTWAVPDCAAPGLVAGDIIMGSFYNYNHLVLSRFAPGASTGTYLGTLDDVDQAQLRYNPALNKTMLVYTQNAGQSLAARIWDGLGLSAPVTIYAGTTLINDIALRARPDGEWGVAWDDGDSNLRMAETSSGLWQADDLLSTNALHLVAGSLNMDYAGNGDAGLVVERSAGGVWFGLKPVGTGPATWEQAAPSTGAEFSSFNVHFVLGVTPQLNYYANGPKVITLAQKNGANWDLGQLPFYISGQPMRSVMSPSGTLALAGADNSNGQSAVCLVSQ